MKPVTTQLPRFPGGHAYANRILRVDLDTMTIDAQESIQYVPKYLAARGLAARICWDEVPEPVDAFSPANPLMIVPGALKAKETLRVSKTLRVWLARRNQIDPKGFQNP